MAGYRRKPKVYRLEFEDPEFDGLVVRAKSLPLREFLDMTSLASEAGKDASKGNEQTEHMLKMFAGSLVEWNLEDEFGDPVPGTYEGIASQDITFVLTVINAWMEAIGDVRPPSPAGSNSGGTSLEAQMPMESLSPSRAS